VNVCRNLPSRAGASLVILHEVLLGSSSLTSITIYFPNEEKEKKRKLLPAILGNECL